MAVSCSVILDFAAAMLDVERFERGGYVLVVVYGRVRLRGGVAVFAVRPAKQMRRRAGGQRTAHSGSAVLCCCVGWRHAAAVALVSN